MCFSATASFSSGAVLSAIGIAAISKVHTPAQRIIAAMPLLFALQQFAEGMLWLAFMHPSYAAWKQPAMYAFLVFAQVVWPLFLPLAMLVLEENKPRKRILAVLTAEGIINVMVILYGLVFHPVKAEITGHHIRYNVEFPSSYRHLSEFVYFMTTIVSTYISSIKRMWLLGTVLIVSYLATAIFYQQYVISVWCFFAALLSVVVLYIIVKLKQDRVSLSLADL